MLDRPTGHGIGAFHYAGISLGGAVGTYLAMRHPERVASLALVCTSAHFGGAVPGGNGPRW